MFYDDVFRQITENSPFSIEATLVIKSKSVNGSEDTSVSYPLKGIFCSGSYGEKEFDKGYSTRKTIKRQTFKISKGSLPDEIKTVDLRKQTLVANGCSWVIRDVVGNDSGILEIDLVPGGNR